MFGTLRNKFRDVRMLTAMFNKAEEFALSDNQQKPGAEHFLLAAVAMPDGAARSLLAEHGGDPDGVADAIQAQYADALSDMGIAVAPEEVESTSPPRKLIYDAAPSGQDVIQNLSKGKKQSPLTSADLLRAVAAQKSGVAIWVLKRMGVEPTQLSQAAD